MTQKLVYVFYACCFMTSSFSMEEGRKKEPIKLSEQFKKLGMTSAIGLGAYGVAALLRTLYLCPGNGFSNMNDFLSHFRKNVNTKNGLYAALGGLYIGGVCYEVESSATKLPWLTWHLIAGYLEKKDPCFKIGSVLSIMGAASSAIKMKKSSFFETPVPSIKKTDQAGSPKKDSWKNYLQAILSFKGYGCIYLPLLIALMRFAYQNRESRTIDSFKAALKLYSLEDLMLFAQCMLVINIFEKGTTKTNVILGSVFSLLLAIFKNDSDALDLTGKSGVLSNLKGLSDVASVARCYFF